MTSAIQPCPFSANAIHSQAQSSFLSRLPSELVLEILRRVGVGSFTDLIKSREVCKKLYPLLDHSDLWKTVFSRSFPSYSLSVPLDFKGASKMLKIQSNVINRVYRLTDFKCGVPHSPICALLTSGEQLVAGDLGRGIRIFSLKTGACLAMFGHAPGGDIAAFAVDNYKLFSFCLDQEVICVDMKTLKGLNGYRMSTEPCQALIVSDGKVISGFADGRIEVRDVKERNLLYTLPGDGNPICSLVASHGKLVSTSMIDICKVQIKCWDLNSEKCLQVWSTLGNIDLLTVLAFDGERLFTGFTLGAEILGWDVATGSCMGAFVGHEEEVDSLAIWESHLISSSKDRNIKIWEIAEKKCLKTFLCDKGRVQWMPVDDQKLFICTTSGSVELWDFQAEDNAILAEIADSLDAALAELNWLADTLEQYFHERDRDRISLALERFSRLPKRVRHKIVSPGKGGLITRARRLVVSIRNYLKTPDLK